MTSNRNQFDANFEILYRMATRLYRLDRFVLMRAENDVSRKGDKDKVSIAVISESHDYLRACMDAVKGNHLRSAGSLLRSLLESSANIFWIFESKSDKRAKKYLNTVETLSAHMDSLLGQMQTPDQRIPLEISSWTTSSAEDRLKAFSPLALMIWDYCSLFTHAQPSLIQYLLQSKNAKVPHFIASQAIIYALTVRLFIAEETTLITVKEKERLLEMTSEIMASLN